MLKNEKTITSIQDSKKQRDSNMELLRIVAMLLVLVVHSGFKSLGYPTTEEAIANPISIYMRYVVESISIICVNVFVLLSGWYGVNVRKQRFLAFIFQVLFFSVGIFLLHFILSLPKISFDGIGSILALKGSDYWFVKAYIGLYILAPILNSFVKNSSRELFKVTLLAFFVFQSVYGWWTSGANWFEGGYSSFSFIGLYLLGRYVRLYSPHYTRFSYTIDFCIYCVLTFSLSAIGFLLTYFGHGLDHILFQYTCPLVILSSLLFLLAFSKMNIKSKTINWIACSSFAIYLLHTNRFIFDDIYCRQIALWSDKLDVSSFALYTFLWIASFFFVAIFIDKIRILCWNHILKIQSHL